MERTLLTTVQDILYLLNINGNTKEYQTKIKLLPNEELHVLKTMKLRQAQHQHRNRKQNTTTALPTIASPNISGPTPDSLNVDVVAVDVWEGFMHEVRRNETDSRYKLIEWLVNNIKMKTSLLDAEPWNETLKGERETALSKLDKATKCLKPIDETLMIWKLPCHGQKYLLSNVPEQVRKPNT